MHFGVALGNGVQYTAGDVAKLMNFSPLQNGIEFRAMMLSNADKDTHAKGNISSVVQSSVMAV